MRGHFYLLVRHLLRQFLTSGLGFGKTVPLVSGNLALGGLLFAILCGGFLFPQLFYGHFRTAAFSLTAGAVVTSTTRNWFIKRGFFRERVFILGQSELAARLIRQLARRPELGMSVVGCADNPDEVFAAYGEFAAATRPFDHVIVALIDRRARMPVNELLKMRLHGIRIDDGAAVLERISGKVEVDDLLPSSWIFDANFGPERFYVLRRVMSSVISLLLILVSLPLFPIIALAVKLSSPGPILYRQTRCGKNGKLFTCLKFRTMAEDTEAESGPVWAAVADPRVTSVGRLLRKTRLDEIPQFWNVLRGDMQLIGPRPERPEFVHRLTETIPYYSIRHIIPPGITGWAQTQYKYGNSNDDAKEKLRYDLYYVKNMSLRLDLVILYETVKTMLSGRGAH